LATGPAVHAGQPRDQSSPSAALNLPARKFDSCAPVNARQQLQRTVRPRLAAAAGVRTVNAMLMLRVIVETVFEMVFAGTITFCLAWAILKSTPLRSGCTGMSAASPDISHYYQHVPAGLNRDSQVAEDL
jgi:hypothetical protein